MSVPFFSIDFRGQEWKSYLKSLLAFSLTDGPQIKELQELLASRYPGHYLTLLPSARAGFGLLLQEMFSKGDELIFPAMGFPLYPRIAALNGIKPIFVDVEPDHYTINHDLIKQAVTPNTKAIVVTHLFGHPAQMDAIMNVADQLGLPVIEDCAQSYDSYFMGQETGTFGMAGIVSCSVMKVPTTLGGGIFITKDKSTHKKIQRRLHDPENNYALRKFIRFYIFNLISILNSYPSVYSLLSHHIFGMMKKRDPAILRKILYSGMGLLTDFDVWERPKFSNYQAGVGNSQFSRAREMTEIRRKYAKIIDTNLEGLSSVSYLQQSKDVYWNYQYYVVHAQGGEKANQVIFDTMFQKGAHLMKEDVWDCTSYDFLKEFHSDCPVASSHNPGLLRIQNNSLLTEEHMVDLARKLKETIINMEN